MRAAGAGREGTGSGSVQRRAAVARGVCGRALSLGADAGRFGSRGRSDRSLAAVRRAVAGEPVGGGGKGTAWGRVSADFKFQFAKCKLAIWNWCLLMRLVIATSFAVVAAFRATGS